MKAKDQNKLVNANTEPSQIRNDLEGVETTIESLRQQFFAMASKLHESLLANKISERYSPSLQETVRAEDKELQVNMNVIYCPYIPYSDMRHYQVTGNENSVNCGELRVSQATNSEVLVKMFECGQSAAKPYEKGRFNDCNQNIPDGMMVQSGLYSDVKRSTEMIDPISKKI